MIKLADLNEEGRSSTDLSSAEQLFLLFLNLMLFNRGKAMSGAPIITAMQLPNVFNSEPPFYIVLSFSLLGCFLHEC